MKELLNEQKKELLNEQKKKLLNEPKNKVFNEPKNKIFKEPNLNNLFSNPIKFILNKQSDRNRKGDILCLRLF